MHSGVEQANFSRSGKRGGIVRREPVENVHPLIRRHPVTGEEALYVNRQFTRRIVGLKREESGALYPCMSYSYDVLISPPILENILKFLVDHIDKGGDVQARVKWAPNTVVLWDNRVTAHVCICFSHFDMCVKYLWFHSPLSLIMANRKNVGMGYESLLRPKDRSLRLMGWI